MELTTIIGIILAFGAIVFGILSSGEGTIMEQLGGFVDIPSVLVVIIGTAAAVIATNTGAQLKAMVKAVSKAFKSVSYDSIATIDSIIELANIARKEGLLALEEVAEKVEDPFMKKAVNLMVDGTDPILLKDILEAEIGAMENRHKSAIGSVEGIAGIGPAFGMLGTLIGLINMLANLNDSDALGSGMSVALVTTFYGSVIANVIANPLANKLKTRSAEEVLQMELILEGILSIHGGENPHIIQEKLNAFLSQTELSAGKNAPKGKGKGEAAEPAEEE